MAEFPNFRRKYSPSALMQGVQQQNQQRYMSPLITPNVGMGNAQGRTSALAPAAGMSTSNPTGAQTMGPAQPLLSRSPATGAAVGSPLPYGRPGEVVTQELVNFEEDFGNRLADQNGQQAAAPAVAPSAIPGSGRAPGPIMQPAEAPRVYSPLRTNQAGQPMYPFARYDQNRPGAELMVDSFTTDRNNPDIRWGEVSPEHRPTGWAPRAVDTNPEISSASPPPVTTPQSRTPSMPGGQAPRASALSGIDMSPRFTNALSPYDGAGAGSAGGSGSGNLGMSPAPAPASPPPVTTPLAPDAPPAAVPDADRRIAGLPVAGRGSSPASREFTPEEHATLTMEQKLAANRAGVFPGADAARRADANNYNRAYDEQYQGIQQGVGITEEERANWTPERGYGFAPSAVQSAASGGAIGAGMRKRFGEGGYFNPSEEDAGPQRRMSDADSMKKMGIIQGAIGPDGRRLGFSKIDQAIARGDTATADKLKQEQDATRERNFARREALRETNGGKTRDELRREKRANSALSRGRITEEEYNNVVTRNDESVERRSALRDAGIPVRGDRNFDAIDRANSGMAGSRPSALGGVPTASGLPDTATQQKAAAKIDALTNPDAPAPTAVGPQGQRDALKRDMAMSAGLKPEMDQEGVRGTLETIPEENLMNIANDPAAARAFVETYKEFDAAQKSVKQDYEKPFDNSQPFFSTELHQLKKAIADHMLKMNTLPADNPEAYQNWLMELIRLRQAGRTGEDRPVGIFEGPTATPREKRPMSILPNETGYAT